MTKPKKPTKRTRSTPIGGGKSTPTQAEALLGRSVALMDQLLAEAEAMLKDGDLEPTTMREIAGVGRAAATLAAELRAREKQAAHLAKKVSPQLVLAYLRGLSDGEWSRLVREVDGARSGESVLS